MRGSGYFPMQRQRLHTPFLVGQEETLLFSEERVKRFFLVLFAAVVFCALCYFWDAPPERAQWWWCQGTSASKKQTNWNRGNLDAQKMRQKSWLDYPLVARPILAPDSEYELISEDLLPGNWKIWSDEQLVWVKIAPLYCFFVRMAVALSQDIPHTYRPQIKTKRQETKTGRSSWHAT